ncbi:hypothetical protein F8M41_007409 [Gigaspora margarita]|uniref:Uncharacterized protein n=1 Tax=Gigaspora margarita TaxID=4874 RepID=A0A8H3X817_GIGMA|nr:hypothetical protein F8M41_007409 [Gigaspora margarita]
MQIVNVTKVTNSSNNCLSNFNSVTNQILESKQDEEMNTSLPKEAIPKGSSPSSKLLKKMEIDAFLDKVHKKKVNDDIRQRNQKKKHQTQESLPILKRKYLITSTRLFSFVIDRTRKKE